MEYEKWKSHSRIISEKNIKNLSTYNRRCLIQYILQQIGGILITGHTGGNLISISDAGCQLYLKAVIMKTLRICFCHLGKLQVMSGDNSRYGQLSYLLQKQAGAIQLIQRVGALE